MQAHVWTTPQNSTERQSSTTYHGIDQKTNKTYHHRYHKTEQNNADYQRSHKTGQNITEQSQFPRLRAVIAIKHTWFLLNSTLQAIMQVIMIRQQQSALHKLSAHQHKLPYPVKYVVRHNPLALAVVTPVALVAPVAQHAVTCCHRTAWFQRLPSVGQVELDNLVKRSEEERVQAS